MMYMNRNRNWFTYSAQGVDWRIDELPYHKD